MNTIDPDKMIGPNEINDEMIRHQLISAASDEKLADWQKNIEPRDKLRFDSETRIRDSCYRLATALGCRDLFQFQEDGFEGELPIEMLGPAVMGGSRSVVKLLNYWKNTSIDVSERPFLEIYELAQSLLEQRIDLQAARLLFRAMLARTQEGQNEDDHFRLKGELVVFESFIDDVDLLIDEQEELVSYLAETGWRDFIESTLPTDTWMPRPWWLSSDLDETYIRYMEWKLSEEEELKSLITALSFIPTKDASNAANAVEKVERNIRRPSDKHSSRYSDVAISAEGKAADRNWTLAAIFKGKIESEEYEFKLLFEEKFEDGYVFESWESVRDTIANAQSEVGLELTVSNLSASNGTQRRYRIRFAKEVHDIEVQWNSERNRFVGTIIVEPLRIDLASSIVHLRRRN